MNLSVIIPSFRSPNYLDLCLRSAWDGAYDPDTIEIIVVLDGFIDESKDVLKKYPEVRVIEFEENQGQMIAHNTGVTLASGQWILIVNDDNVFPQGWDDRLAEAAKDGYVIAPNQIEPTPSIFKSFNIKNFGTTPEDFDYEAFTRYTNLINRHQFSSDGQTWPLFMQKRDYMILGGIDQNYPSPAVADWDFFMRCEMMGLKCERFYGAHFYHFGSSSTKKTPEQAHQHSLKEQQSFGYFYHKWGFWPKLDENNSKIPYGKIERGVEF